MTCPVHETATPPRPTAGSARPRIALIGNPNTGKTTLFNRLTGARQKVANYPGVTVESKLGLAALEGHDAWIIDLPGAYSLAAVSADERLVFDTLANDLAPDLVVLVASATNLRRSLFLGSQAADLGLPTVIAVNLIDDAERAGLDIDTALLSERLGVPVVALAAASGRGLDDLRHAIANSLRHPRVMKAPAWPEPVHAAVRLIGAAAGRATGRRPRRAECRRILFDVDSAIPARLGWAARDCQACLRRAHCLLEDLGFDPLSTEAVQRDHWIREVLNGAVRQHVPPRQQPGAWLDQLLLHRTLGLVIFAAVMFGVFYSVYAIAEPLTAGIEAALAALTALAQTLPEGLPRSLVSDGVIAGVGAVLAFLPQILVLFLFIGLLEETGYLARAAFLMDRVFAWAGLNGKSFVPLLSGYACAVPGILATRSMEDQRARILTAIIVPLTSCSARLPVYVLVIGAVLQPAFGAVAAGTALFAIHLLGIALALPIAWLVNRTVLKRGRTPFVLEIPPYRAPRLNDLAWRLFERGREFLVRAGTLIFIVAVAVWALSYFPRPPAVAENVTASAAARVAASEGLDLQAARDLLAGERSAELQIEIDAAYFEGSILGRLGRALQPAFAPAGFDWRLTVAVLASIPAREAALPALGVLFRLDDDPLEDAGTLRSTLATATWPDGRPLLTPAAALALMLFFALALQCGATLLVLGKEVGWRWSAFSFTVNTTLAWTLSVAAYQTLTALGG
jgi:ferrous iron transport protein B